MGVNLMASDTIIMNLTRAFSIWSKGLMAGSYLARVLLANIMDCLPRGTVGKASMPSRMSSLEIPFSY
jgi:hypothetical protein